MEGVRNPNHIFDKSEQGLAYQSNNDENIVEAKIRPDQSASDETREDHYAAQSQGEDCDPDNDWCAIGGAHDEIGNVV